MNQATLFEMDDQMRQCIAYCTECHTICTATISHCLSMGGEHATKHHIGILLDCADACRISADFMLRSSAMHNQTCKLCAEACERCATECARFGNDPQMQACAEACRRCAETCRAMAA